MWNQPTSLADFLLPLCDVRSLDVGIFEPKAMWNASFVDDLRPLMLKSTMVRLLSSS